MHRKRKKNDPIPYVIMITRFFNHFEFAEPTTTTRLDNNNNNNKIGKAIMAQMGIKKVKNVWCYGAVTPPSPVQMDDASIAAVLQ